MNLENFKVKSGVKAIICEITPALAKSLLDSSDHNLQRTSNLANIASFAQDMREGRWELNGEAIALDTRGNIINGFHRLKAIVLSCVPVRTVIITGVKPECIHTYDQNKKRTKKETTEVVTKDKKFADVKTACVAGYYERFIEKRRGTAASGKNMEKISGTSKHVFTTSQHTQYLKEQKEELEYMSPLIEETFLQTKKNLGSIIGKAAYCGVFYAIWYINEKKGNDLHVFEFFNILSTGLAKDLFPGNKVCPILLASKRLQLSENKAQSLTNQKKNKLNSGKKQLLIIQAWTLWVESKSRVKLPAMPPVFEDIKTTGSRFKNS
jgi:hypothetical protein